MSRLDVVKGLVSKQKEKQHTLKKDMENNAERIKRLKAFAENTPEYLKQLNKEFEELTSLNDNEVTMLFVVAGLQVLRQHFLTNFKPRLDDQTAAKDTWGHKDEHSDRHQWYYNPTLNEISNNPVPFDANIGANGALAGGGKLGHRATAIGHDPLLGLIFGTANIATSTLTNYKFESYHIRTHNVLHKDVFAEKADTKKVLERTLNKLMYEGFDGKAKVGVSFLKEIIHLRTDMKSHNGLPLPIISVIDPKMASKLAEYGFDFTNVVTVVEQVMMARLINGLIAMYHYSFYDGSISEDLYKVKTKKIICYSNVIASGINLAEVYITDNMNLLDIGGIANTIYEVVTSGKFIKKVKRDFIFGEYDAALAAL